GLIHEVFPGAQFIHMIRNGYDVVKSLQNVSFAPRNISWNTRTWISSVRSGRAAAKQLPPGLYTEVRYEELVKKPTDVLTGLCEFLGEPFSESMLSFHNPENNTWKLKDDPLQERPLSKYREMPFWSRLMFSRLAAPLMLELGYQAT